MEVERIARAKVNLALHVTARRADGYHEIDTLVGFADIGDRLAAAAAPAGTIELAVSGPFGAQLAGADNLVERAARRLGEAAAAAGHDCGGARLALEKRLPVASGLGGGSADAAATLSALRQLWRLPAGFDLKPVAVGLGADVAMCLESVPLRARGIGERIDVLADAGPLHAVLVNPGVAVATPQVFAALACKDNAAIGALPEDPFDPAWLSTLRNDLQAPAIALAPVIADVLEAIAAQAGCRLARMSGSGATCFGLFDDRETAARARARIIDTAPQWWSVLTEIGGSPAVERGAR